MINTRPQRAGSRPTTAFGALLAAPSGTPPPSGWPLVLWLHGAGGKGTDIDLLRAELPKSISATDELPGYVLAPQCPPRSGWPADDLAVFLTEAVDELPIDRRRVTATGPSMGGRGVYELAYDHSHLLAGIAPVCAFGIPTLAPRLRHLPIWAFHGTSDDVLPVARGDEMVAALTASGANVRYERLSDAGHDIAPAVYARPALWEWLFTRCREGS